MSLVPFRRQELSVVCSQFRSKICLVGANFFFFSRVNGILLFRRHLVHLPFGFILRSLCFPLSFEVYMQFFCSIFSITSVATRLVDFVLPI